MSEFSSEQEERINYLRQRGVEIEFPSDRKSNNDKSNNDTSIINITVVKIPCDDNEECKEVTVPIDVASSGDQLPSLLRVYFNKNNNIDINEVKTLASQQFSSSEINITEDVISNMKQNSSVEVFPLSHPGNHNNNCKVSLYLDEIGQIKKLPSNRRAIALASTCGFKDVPLVGDMFVGRVGPNKNNNITNLDFYISELDSDSNWLQGIEARNYEYSVSTNRIASGKDIENELVSGPNPNNSDLNWSETNEYIEVVISIPKDIKTFTKKDLTIKFAARSVSVYIRNTTNGKIEVTRGNENVTINSGELAPLWTSSKKLKGSISVDDCTWCISNNTIELSLEKSTPGRWGTLEVE